MTIELFQGRAEALYNRLEEIKTGGATSIQVIPTKEGGSYIIIFS